MSKSLSALLRSIRTASGASLREVERKTKISNAYLSQLENGKGGEPSPHILYKLADFYGVPYESLMEAAGYLQSSAKILRREKSNKRLGALEVALMSAKLNKREQEKVADFINYLRSQRRKT